MKTLKSHMIVPDTGPYVCGLWFKTPTFREKHRDEPRFLRDVQESGTV
jgi:hypothetical protein